jgi:hypothetical protein
MKLFKSSLILLVILSAVSIPFLNGCSKIKAIKEVSDMVKGDRLYFCERYVTKEIGEDTKFKKGKVTVMVKLKNAIGESSVDINITDLSTGKAVDTFPFTVQPGWDYIHFDDVDFKDTGKFKVSCIKKNGDVIATGEVEII